MTALNLAGNAVTEAAAIVLAGMMAVIAGIMRGDKVEELVQPPTTPATRMYTGGEIPRQMVRRKLCAVVAIHFTGVESVGIGTRPM